jgi:hypothetical protein
VAYLLDLVRRYPVSSNVRDVPRIPPKSPNINHCSSVAQCDTSIGWFSLTTIANLRFYVAGSPAGTLTAGSSFAMERL